MQTENENEALGVAEDELTDPPLLDGIIPKEPENELVQSMKKVAASYDEPLKNMPIYQENMVGRVSEEVLAQQRTQNFTKDDVMVHIEATADMVKKSQKRVSKTLAVLRDVRGLDVKPLIAIAKKAQSELSGLTNTLYQTRLVMKDNLCFVEEAMDKSTKALREFWKITHAQPAWVQNEKMSFEQVKQLLKTS